MRITKRIVNSKHHTIGFRIDGKRLTRGSVVKMVRRGKIKNLVAKKGKHGWYIASTRNVASLYNLPIEVEA